MSVCWYAHVNAPGLKSPEEDIGSAGGVTVSRELPGRVLGTEPGSPRRASRAHDSKADSLTLLGFHKCPANIFAHNSLHTCMFSEISKFLKSYVRSTLSTSHMAIIWEWTSPSADPYVRGHCWALTPKHFHMCFQEQHCLKCHDASSLVGTSTQTPSVSVRAHIPHSGCKPGLSSVQTAYRLCPVEVSGFPSRERCQEISWIRAIPNCCIL